MSQELIYPLGVNTALLSKSKEAPGEAGQVQELSADTWDPLPVARTGHCRTTANRTGHTPSTPEGPMKTRKTSLRHHRLWRV